MDKGLEEAIDRVGRDRVFALANANGWVFPDAPPKYVWWQIVAEIERQDTQQARVLEPLA